MLSRFHCKQPPCIAMKKRLKYIALMAGSAVVLSSCVVYDYPMYTSASVGVGGPGWSTSVEWTNASYDVNGFPIYGYSYGRPVYGYTAAGVAIFSIAAITAACLVPDWGPAPWYCGHWHYPAHVHRVAVPHHHPSGHHPGVRPPHGGHHGGGHHAGIRPSQGGHHAGGRPSHGGHHVAGRPQAGGHHQSAGRPSHASRPGVQPRPQAGKRPQMGNRPQVNSRPQMNRRPQVNSRPRVSSRPQMRASRPQMSSRSHSSFRSHGGGSRGGFGGGRGGHRR